MRKTDWMQANFAERSVCFFSEILDFLAERSGLSI